MSPLTPWSPQDSLEAITVAELWHGNDTPQTMTRDVALRIPAVKRSHDIVCGVLARMQWRHYQDAVRSAVQPSWLVTSQSGVSPRNLRWGVVSDLFMHGWAVIGFHLGPDGRPDDALHVPFGWWTLEATSEISVSDRIPSRYRDRLVAIPLGYGSNGMLVDGRDTMVAARKIEAAYRDRIDNPIPQTDLELTAERWDMWDKEEREEFRKLWIAGRRVENGAVALRPEWVKPNYAASVPADLFESGRNASRLDLANHAGIPAALVEGAKQGGSGGDMHYSTEAGGATRNELWDFGLVKYADAIESRLSLDDVCAPGASIRVDPSDYLTAPTPTEAPTSED